MVRFGSSLSAAELMQYRRPVGRTVVEDVAEMSATIAALHFGAHHAVGLVGPSFHRLLLRRRPEAWPARARIELLDRSEHHLAAPRAAIFARLSGVVVFTGEGPFGALLAQNVVLRRRELAAPLGVAFLDLVGHTGSLINAPPRDMIAQPSSGRPLASFHLRHAPGRRARGSGKVSRRPRWWSGGAPRHTGARRRSVLGASDRRRRGGPPTGATAPGCLPRNEP
jgi:hypothetical protein